MERPSRRNRSSIYNNSKTIGEHTKTPNRRSGSTSSNENTSISSNESNSPRSNVVATHDETSKKDRQIHQEDERMPKNVHNTDKKEAKGTELMTIEKEEQNQERQVNDTYGKDRKLRKPRLRSDSVASTTSSKSSALELLENHDNPASRHTDEDEDLDEDHEDGDSDAATSARRQDELFERQREKLEELAKKKQMIEDGTLAEYCRRITEFKSERNHALKTAEFHKTLQLKNGDELYQVDLQRAENIWSQAKEAMKQNMLQKMDTVMQQLQEEWKATLQITDDSIHQMNNATQTSYIRPPVVVKRRKLTGNKVDTKVADEKLMEDNQLEEYTKTMQSILPLSQIETSTDLMSIVQKRMQHSATVHTLISEKDQIENTKVLKNQLLHGECHYEEGDEVILTIPILNTQIVATMISITDNAIYIKIQSPLSSEFGPPIHDLQNTSTVRVHIDLLKYKRCQLQPFYRGNAGLESLQSTGWAECEPF